MNRFVLSSLVTTALIAVIGASVGIAPANAVPITFTFSGIATGTLGGNDFTDANFSFDVVTDSNLITEVEPESFESPQIPNALFSIGGVNGTLGFPVGIAGTTNDNFVSLLDYSDPLNPIVMLSVGDPSFSENDPVFGVYDFRRAFGPVTDSGEPGSDINSRLTSEGLLTFSSVSPATFQATVGAVTVPETGTFALVLPALGIIGAVVRRRRMTA